MELAIKCHSENDYLRAKEVMKPLLSAFPSHPDINHLYATILLSNCEYSTAILHFQIALNYKSKDVGLLNDLGTALSANGDLDSAIKTLEKAVKLSHYAVPIVVNLVNALIKNDNFAGAFDYIEKSINLHSNDASLHFVKGNVFKSQNRYPEAINSYKHATTLNSDYFQAFYNLALTLQADENLEEALDNCQKAINVNPKYRQAHMLAGEINEQQGRISEAIRSYETCLKIDPIKVDAYWSLANIGYRFDKEMFATLLGMRSLSLPEKEEVYLYFTLAKALEDIEEYEDSFNFLVKANQLKHKSINYDSKNMSQLIAMLKTRLDFDVLQKLSTLSDSELEPVFIVGMPRSGTSLVEQILASHSSIEGGGELDTSLTLLFDALPNITGREWSDSLKNLDKNSLNLLADRYAQENSKLVSQNQKFTDKLPFNFALIGLLSLVFPRAKFIHIYKNPIDSCLSCFKQLFTEGQEFSYSLSDIADYYALYSDVVDYWSNMLPNSIMHVSYESLVSAPEKNISKILAYVGLPWEAECLNFYNYSRTVRTASTAQVRKKIYTTSSYRWENYKEQLTPLLQTLKREIPSSNRVWSYFK